MNRDLLREEIERRRVLAIISHPDAGKTTITEKLLLFGNLIKIAGTIKSKKSDRHATSDWMTMEQEEEYLLRRLLCNFLTRTGW